MAESAEERHRDDAVEAAGQFIDWQAWWSERVQESSTEEWKQKRMRAVGKSQKLLKRGKLLQYAKQPEHVQRGLDEARLTEWKKWQKHSAADVISAQEAARLVMEGAEEIGTQWIEVDRNEKVRVEAEQADDIPMNLKSRLEKREVRSDSPTADAEGIHLVFSFASSRTAKVWCGDLESAYFTGERMSRVLLLRQPRSGLPGLKPDDRLLARVLVYGTQDAGRGFWKKFRRTLIAGGVRENRVLSAVYTLKVDGQLRGIVATHVDDLFVRLRRTCRPGCDRSHQTAFDLVQGVRVQLLVLWARGATGRREWRLFCACYL